MVDYAIETSKPASKSIENRVYLKISNKEE